MADPDDRRIDPRYDPAFQRGYGEAAGPTPVGGRGSAAESVGADTGRSARRPRPSRAVSAEEALSHTAAPARVEGRRADTRDPARDPETRPEHRHPEHDDEHVESGRNPYEIVLLVIGTVLVVASAALINASRGLFLDAPENEFEYWLLTLAGTAAPAVLAVGMLTLIALLFVRAHRWSLRR